MDPVLDSRLKSIEDKLDENHKMLTRVRRTQIHGQLFKIFYWSIIILLALGSLYFIKPYLNQLLETYTGVQDASDQFQDNIPNLRNVNQLINQIQGI